MNSFIEHDDCSSCEICDNNSRRHILNHLYRVNDFKKNIMSKEWALKFLKLHMCNKTLVNQFEDRSSFVEYLNKFNLSCDDLSIFENAHYHTRVGGDRIHILSLSLVFNQFLNKDMICVGCKNAIVLHIKNLDYMKFNIETFDVYITDFVLRLLKRKIKGNK